MTYSKIWVKSDSFKLQGAFVAEWDFFHKILCSTVLNLQQQMGKTWQSLFDNKIEKVAVPLWKIPIYNNSEMRLQPVILFGNLQEKQKVIFFSKFFDECKIFF